MQPKVDVPIPDNGAKVLVVKFNDYQCPACKITHDLYKGVLNETRLPGRSVTSSSITRWSPSATSMFRAATITRRARRRRQW